MTEIIGKKQRYSSSVFGATVMEGNPLELTPVSMYKRA